MQFAIGFLDLAMPGMDGVTLASRLREQFPPTALTLVSMTGFGTVPATALAGSFDRHLLKPASTETVARLLQACEEGSDPEGARPPDR
jgi:CheY-like chemotaxis protein